MLGNILLVTTGLCIALMAGLFFTFSNSINESLHRLKDEEFVRAWQLINRIIQNPLFLLAFMAPLFLLPIVSFMHRGDGLQFILLLAASAAYIFGVLGTTFGGNIPLNNKLDTFPLESAGSADTAAARKAFEAPWYRLNAIRTFFAVVAVVLFFSACLA
jgi:uncharacterized membrane protein